MNEELSGKLVEIIDAIQATASKAGEFAMTQLPSIAQEYVVYGRVKSLATLAILLLLAAGFLLAARWAYKNPWNTSPYSWDEGKKRSESNLWMIALCSMLGSLFTLLSAATFDYLVWFAPKVWLLKALANLVK